MDRCTEKDMPSVALDCVSRSTNKDRLNLDLVLDGVVVDERIEAAYAIVELGERKSKTGVGLPSSSSAEDEDLDIDETELYHQVPRSPDCLRECGRGVCNRSANVNPSRGAGSLLRKIGHVQGAVMPTRTLGNPLQKLTSKRHHEDDAIRDETKAKLARMLIERKSSQEEAGKPSPDDGTCRKYSENDSDEEPVTVSGRFVRTSMPVLQSMSIASNMKSTTNYKNLFENFHVKSEQFTSAEKLHSSFPEDITNEQAVLLKGIDNYQYQILPREISSQRRLEEVSNLKFNDSTKNHKISSSEISSKNSASYNSSSLLESSVLESEGDSYLSECMSASNKDADRSSEIEKQSARDRHCLLIGPADCPTSASGNAGLLQYYVLPVIKTLPDSVNSDFHGVQPAVGGSVDALKWLEHFSKGKGHYSEPVPNVVPNVPETMQWNARRKYLLSRSSDGIFNYYDTSSSALSEGGPLLSGFIESLSLQNLSHIHRDSPKMSNSCRQLKSQKRDVVVNEYKKSQSIEKKLMEHHATSNGETKMSNARRRILGIADALEMVKGGEFGSSRTLRNLYTRVKTRNIADSSAYLLQGSKLRIGTKFQILGSEEQEQELPLDLSWCHRKMYGQPPEVKFEAEPCSLYLPSCETVLSPDGYKQNVCSLSSKAAIENSTSSDSLQMKADHTVGSGSDCSKNNKDGDKQLDGLSPHSVPNSHLPPKKRKFICTMSQNCDFPESKAPLSTKSTFPFQALPIESSTYISAKSCSGQTLHGRTFSETGLSKSQVVLTVLFVPLCFGSRLFNRSSIIY